MPVLLKVHRPKNLLYVRYSGFAGISESMQAFSTYMSRPDFQSGRDLLVDLSHLTGHEKASPHLIRHHAQMTEVFQSKGRRPLVVFYAPTRVAQGMALLSARPWDQLDIITPVILEQEIDVLEMLGVTEPNLETFLQETL
ncbi:hypothetical protein [Shimia thalassica]|uniref:hypothetical protein n=1 Tax=Shimia thalassica TaxID=1715693 RepID=UPI0026E42914|nr:hypothetical protein [Shimia thalassica]MDO6483687.1 hypothetical protein [Shimia thalassica]